MIKGIKATNFLSWKSLSFDVKNGVTLISGFNYDDGRAEGSGKSAILNALCYGLFGRTAKDTSVDSVIKNGESTCKVEIELLDGFKVVRSRKPNDLYVEYNSETARGQDMKATQKLIEAHLGFNFNTFITSVYFSQNSQNSFIYLSEEDKAKFLSELQDLSQFDRARKITMEFIKAIREDLANIDNKKANTRNLYSLLNEQRLKVNSMIDKWDETNKAEIAKVTAHLEELQTVDLTEDIATEIKDVEADLEVLTEDNNEMLQEIAIASKVQQNLDRTIGRIATLGMDIQELEEYLSKLQSGETQDCPTCGSPLHMSGDEKLNKHMEEKTALVWGMLKDRAALVEEVNKTVVPDTAELGASIKYNKGTIENIKTILSALRVKEVGNAKVQESIKNCKEQLAKLEQANCDELIMQEADMTQEEACLLSTEQSLYEEYRELADNMKLYTIAYDSFKEVKQLTYIGFLNEINGLVNKYASEMFDIGIQVHFTNIGEEGALNKVVTKIAINGVERSFGLLSGGQQKRIEMAVFLSLSEIMNRRLGNVLNLRILDEVMTGLSAESSAKVITLLKSLAGSTLVIEHNEQVKSIIDQTFDIEYRGGTSNAR